MDAVDRKIVAILQEDSRITSTQLAKLLPLSVSATSERLRRLQTTGLIEKFTITVDPVAAGRPIEALVDVRIAPGTYSNAFDARLGELSGVVDAVHLSGRFDVQLRVAVTNVAELDQLLETLKDEWEAQETNTRLVLRRIGGFPRPVQIAGD